MSLREQMLDQYRLTTAEITYAMPDHPHLLQTYVWQELDLVPQHPVLRRFLTFWQRELEGKLRHVRVTTCPVVSPGELQHLQGEFLVQ